MYMGTIDGLYILPYINSISHFPANKNVSANNIKNEKITRTTLAIEALRVSCSCDANFGKRTVPTAMGMKGSNSAKETAIE